MVKIVGYGSLINKASFERTIPWRKPQQIWVRGYKRVFNLIPSRLQLYKLYDANHAKGEIAVLNAVPDKDSEFNALLFEINEGELDIIKLRLKSYHAEETDVFDFKTNKKISKVLIFVGNEKCSGEEILNNDILPIPKYVELCKKGAKTVGKNFYKEWLNTTYRGDGSLIKNH